MTRKEINANSYWRRRENGLCPRCGNPLDRDGYYCKKCLEKHNEYKRENKKFFRENGVCPECGKEKLFGDEKMCIACRQRSYERRKPLTEEQRIKNNKKFRERQNYLYKQRSEQGICTRCGKRKPEAGKKKCGICLAKDSDLHKIKGKNIREYRKENHLCYHCGKEIDRKSGQLCQSCWDRCYENGLKSGGGNDYWKKDNRLISIK